MKKKPNIVFIMCDQQQADWLSCYGSAYSQTPHLDKLAASGMRFNAAYTTSPVCTPARAGLFTGLYSSSAGSACNQLPLFDGVKNTGEYFQDAGFETAYVGKWHLDGPEGRYYGSGVAAKGFPQEWWYDGKNFMDDVGPDGFQKWKKGVGLSIEDCWGTRVADRAEKFIEKKSNGSSPFYLVVSFDEPHGPSSAPEKFYEKYKGTKRPRTPNMDDDLSGKPYTHQALREMQSFNGLVPPGEDPNNSPKNYGCNEYIDEQVGRVIDAVDRFCKEETIIVYTADHGDHAGAHQLTAKGATMYEEIVRVPLLIRVPGLIDGGSVCDELVSHIDLAPSLFSLAGIPWPDTHDCHEGKPTFNFEGKDLKPIFMDSKNSVQDEIFMEFTRFGLPHSTRLGFTPIKCIRTKNFKLVLNLLDTDELYDLRIDPYECKNIINEKETSTIRDILHDRILSWMDQRQDPFRGNGWWQRSWRPDKKMPAKYDL